MRWNIISGWAELSLILAVYNMFEPATSLDAAITIFRNADELTRLGMVAASMIAASGLTSMLKAFAHGIGLPWAVHQIVQALVTWLKGRH